jgi:gluconate kinase
VREGGRSTSPAPCRIREASTGTSTAVVLLHASADVLLRRIAKRETNHYGKSPEERDLILRHLAEVEPLLRATCTHEVDATAPLEVVVAQLVAIGEEAEE